MSTVIRDDRSAMTVRRASAGQSCVVAAAFAASMVCVPVAGSQTVPVSVQGEHGLYHVSATFTTPQPAAIGHAVLTDYEQIPSFLPDVRRSHVLERDGERAVVEQEAVAKVLFFSKRVRLVLEIREAPALIAFRDRSGESFIRYEGQWTLRDEGDRAVIGYNLTAQPRFDVPDFLLARLLKRDAERMIERIKTEIAARAARTALQSRRWLSLGHDAPCSTAVHKEFTMSDPSNAQRRPHPQPLAAPYLEVDLTRELEQLHREPGWNSGQNAKTLVKYDDLRIVLMALQAEARIPGHQTEGRISIHTVVGHIKVRAQGRTFDLPAGRLLALDRGVPHDVEALEDSAFLLTIAWRARKA